MKTKHINQPVVLLAATTWWPLSAKLAVSLVSQGWNVKAICPVGHSVRYVDGLNQVYVYRRIGSLRALRKSILASSPDLVVPCDDGVVEQLHALFQEHPELRPLITRSLGAAKWFPVVSSREKLLRVAADMQIRVPRNMRVSGRADLHDWFARKPQAAVLKQDGTFGGNGVRVVRTLTEAITEFDRMSKQLPWPTVCKRMIINRDPVALWNKLRGAEPEVTLQEYIDGRPANVMMACLNGKMLGAVAVDVLCSQGKMGAAIVVRLIEHNEIVNAACSLARRLELSGFYGLDFVIEATSGAAYLIEMNPRCTQLGHLPIEGRGDLASLLSADFGLRRQTNLASNYVGLTVGETVAFYPKASLSDAKRRFVREGYSDAPYHQPALMRELMKPDWPDRSWLARMYHWIRPPQREATAIFEEQTTVAGAK